MNWTEKELKVIYYAGKENEEIVTYRASEFPSWEHWCSMLDELEKAGYIVESDVQN